MQIAKKAADMRAKLRKKITRSDVLALFCVPYFDDFDIVDEEAVAVVVEQSHIVVLYFKNIMNSMSKLIKVHQIFIFLLRIYSYLQQMHSRFSCVYKSMCENR